MRIYSATLLALLLTACGGGGDSSSNSSTKTPSAYTLTGLVFTDAANVEHSEIVTSNTITISGLGSGVVIPLSVNAGTTIVKNGSPISTIQTTLQDGEMVALRRTSLGFGLSTSATASVGSASTVWKITTKLPNIAYDAEGITYNETQFSDVYFAVPIKPSVGFTAHYVGVSIGGSNFPEGIYSAYSSLSIYSDNSGVPGILISTTNNFLNYFNTPLTKLDGTIFSNYSFPQAKLADSGVSLLANTVYWIVVRYPTPTIPSVDKVNLNTIGLLRKRSTDGVHWMNWSESGSQYGLNNGLDLSASYLPGHFLAN